MGESNRSSYVIARRKYLNITQLSTLFGADIPVVRRFVESRTSRITITESTPELEIARNFLTDMVEQLSQDTWRAYTPAAYSTRPEPDNHRAYVIPDIIDPHLAVDFVKVNVGAEQTKDLFNKPWISQVVGKLTDVTLSMLPGAAALAASVHVAKDDNDGDDSTGGYELYCHF